MTRSTLPVLLFALSSLATLVPMGHAAAQSRCEAPRLLLTVDKSSSMLGELADGRTKWDATREAIAELADGFADRIDMGLQPFPHPDRCAPGRVTVDVDRNDAETLIGALGEPPPESGSFTPMAQTLDALLEYAPLATDERDRHVVLVTDGWQWCAPYDPGTRFAPVSSVERLREAGITVHVVGFGGGVDALTLNRAAVAAGTALPGCDPDLADPDAMNHCYLQAHDLDGLRMALDSIGRLVTDEVCDGYDNNCDGVIDEGWDRDADGYTVCGSDPSDPTRPGHTDDGDVDCDDGEPTVYPGAPEVCDGLDNDCDGHVDPGCHCLDGETRPCGSEIGACVPGSQTCVDGTWAVCEDGVVAAPETCDGVDEDCDEEVDEGAECAEGEVCMDGACVDPDGGETYPDDGDGGPMPEDGTGNGDGGKEDEGGCGCTTVGAGRTLPNPVAFLAAAGFLGLLLRRRRRA